MIPRTLYIKFARGSGKGLWNLVKLTELLCLYDACVKFERRAIMTNRKKVIVVGFNEESLGRIYISGIRKRFENVSPIPVVKVHATGFETPNYHVCLISKEYSDCTHRIPADFAYGPEWLRDKVCAFEGCRCEYSLSVPDLVTFIEERETEIRKTVINSGYDSGIYNDGAHGGFTTPTKLHVGTLYIKHPEIKKVHFSGPVTCVIWTDGTKTLVRCQDGETLDPEKGLAMAISKKFLGTNATGSNYYDEFHKWLPKKEEKISPKDWADGLTNALRGLCRDSLTAGKALQGVVYRFVNGQWGSPSKEHAKDMAAVGEAIAEGLKQGDRRETCRERLKREHPEFVGPDHLGGCYSCPHKFGYTTKTGLCKFAGCASSSEKDALCAKCWDRPVETKHDGYKADYVFVDETPMRSGDLSWSEKNPKYEFTGETKMTNGRTVRRIRAARDIYLPAPNPKQKPILFVKKGTLGGWIEKAENLTQAGTCWVGENAVVMDNANVLDNAYVYGRALVRNNAQVMGDAIVCGHAKISGNAVIGGHAYIHGNAWVCDHAKVLHNANVGGEAWIGDHAIIAHDCTITGRVVIGGSFTYEGVTRE